MKLEFSRQIFEKYSKFMKIHLLLAELLHPDNEIDVFHAAVSGFSQFCERALNAEVYRVRTQIWRLNCFLGGKVERAFVVVSFVTLNSSIDWITVELLTGYPSSS